MLSVGRPALTARSLTTQQARKPRTGCAAAIRVCIVWDAGSWLQAGLLAARYAAARGRPAASASTINGAVVVDDLSDAGERAAVLLCSPLIAVTSRLVRAP